MKIASTKKPKPNIPATGARATSAKSKKVQFDAAYGTHTETPEEEKEPQPGKSTQQQRSSSLPSAQSKEKKKF